MTVSSSASDSCLSTGWAAVVKSSRSETDSTEDWVILYTVSSGIVKLNSVTFFWLKSKKFFDFLLRLAGVKSWLNIVIHRGSVVDYFRLLTI